MDKITTAECNRVVAILEDSVERLMLLSYVPEGAHEAILGELTVIGFSGLLLGTIQAGSEDSLFGRFSEHYLGDAHELFELLGIGRVDEETR